MDSSREQIRSNYEKFQVMLAEILREFDEVPVELVLKHAQMAAVFAWSKSCGFFASPELEAILARVSAKLPAHQRPAGKAAGGRHVVTVLSAVYGIGGHSRLAWRWFQLDAASTHTLILTQQEHIEIPAQFKEMAACGRLRLIVLDQPTLWERAIALREHVAGADVVVLLIHPHDVVPNVALAAMPDAPPVLFQDHASHTFWLGATVSRLVLSETGTNVARRGIPARHICWNPLPMDFRRLDEKAGVDVRSAYGIPSDAPLLLTAGAAHKYSAVDGLSLPRLLMPLMEENADIHLLAAGVGIPGMPAAPVWEEMVARFGSRLHFIGRVDEATLTACYQASDVYLDSMPLSSPTTLFEAAASGLPVVRFAPQDWRDSEFALDMETIPTLHYIWSDEDDYREDIRRLLRDRAYRDWRSRTGNQAVRLVHGDDTFIHAVETAYDRAVHTPLIALDAGAGDFRYDRLSDLLNQLFENLLLQDRLETDWKLYAVAASLARRGEVDAAMSRLISLAEKGTPHWQVYNDIGVMAREKGDFPAAIELFQCAVQVSREPNAASLNLAEVLLASGERGQASAIMAGYVERHPDSEAALALLAAIQDQ